MNSQLFRSRIVAVAWAPLEGQRPRHAGCNARLGDHGLTVRVPLAHLTLDDGSSGFGQARVTAQDAQRLVGRSLAELFVPGRGSTELGRPFDFPLWDLVAKQLGQPVYQVAAQFVGKEAATPLHVPCYDTSLYFDDLHLADQDEAVSLIADEARQGYARGHRHFKIKVGRGARHLPLEEGTQRDIAIIHAVRAVAGPAGKIMIDANNGYNLNLTKRVLQESAAANVFWMEEAFHEDPVLYRDLHAWLQAEGIATLIADGEGLAAPPLLEWVREGLVQVVQYDIHSYSFTAWLALGQQLDAWGVRSAPHHYGGHIGNYTAPHLAAAVEGFTFVEWDEASTPGIDAPGYVVAEGTVRVPDAPGFGLTLDEAAFQQAVAERGFVVQG
ncbi:MAG: enolase C-terminal domain-like protein [Caldilineaceae bacterium]